MQYRLTSMIILRKQYESKEVKQSKQEIKQDKN